MPYQDGLFLLHGSGNSSGALTSTANALTGVSQSGTTLTYTVSTGQVVPGQVVVLVGGAPTVSTQVVIVSILTGGGGTGTATVNISQTVTSTTATAYPATLGDTWLASGSQYSNLELDFGPPTAGTYYPWLPQFPSLTEKGYTNPPEVVGEGGTQYGIHFIVLSPFNTLTSTTVEAVSNSTSSATTVIASRTLTLAQLQVNGAHYFVPVPGPAILEFLRAHSTITGSNPTLGTCEIYFGPRTGGEL